MKTEYTIVRRSDLEGLIVAVTSHLENDWREQGGPLFAHDPNAGVGPVYMQAMVRELQEQPNPVPQDTDITRYQPGTVDRGSEVLPYMTAEPLGAYVSYTTHVDKMRTDAKRIKALEHALHLISLSDKDNGTTLQEKFDSAVRLARCGLRDAAP